MRGMTNSLKFRLNCARFHLILAFCLAFLLSDVDILANVVAGEALNCPLDHQIAVASVVMNRVADPRFPNTVKGVVGQQGQYSETYLTGQAPKSCYEAAQIAMDGDHDVPPDVVYQANFPQGEVWWRSDIDTGWFRSSTYFCKG